MPSSEVQRLLKGTEEKWFQLMLILGSHWISKLETSKLHDSIKALISPIVASNISPVWLSSGFVTNTILPILGWDVVKHTLLYVYLPSLNCEASGCFLDTGGGGGEALVRNQSYITAKRQQCKVKVKYCTVMLLCILFTELPCTFCIVMNCNNSTASLNFNLPL